MRQNCHERLFAAKPHKHVYFMDRTRAPGHGFYMPANMIKRRLGNAVADELGKQIREGRYSTRLPGEPSLARELGVSRGVLREALALLAREGLVARKKGCHTRVKAGRASRVRKEVVLLSDHRGQRHDRPVFGNALDLLEQELRRRDIVTHQVLCSGDAERTSRRIRKLTMEFSHPAWVLFRCSREMQLLFEETNLPGVVLGSCHAGVGLPSIDTDQAAIARHAAGKFISLGHRRVGVFHPHEVRAGDERALLAFREEVRRGGGEVAGIAGEAGTAQARRAVARALPSLTAVYSLREYAAIWLHSLLPRMGVRVPEDCALLSRTHLPVFALLTPALAGYRVLDERIIRKAAAFIERIISGQEKPRRPAFLIPEFVPGDSLGPPSRDASRK